MFALAGLMISGVVAGMAQGARFSQQLTATEQTATGITKLSSDQMAVLDALVRNDEAIRARPDPSHPMPARFSQRVSAGERKSAGLDRLSETELNRLDANVEQCEAGSPPEGAPRSAAALQPRLNRPGPEIHGMFTLTYGAGRGGYSEKGGEMLLNYDDPVHGFSLGVSYGEMTGTVPFFRRGGVPGDTGLPPVH